MAQPALGAESGEFAALDRGLPQHPPEWSEWSTTCRPAFSGGCWLKTGLCRAAGVSVYPQILLMKQKYLESLMGFPKKRRTGE